MRREKKVFYKKLIALVLPIAIQIFGKTRQGSRRGSSLYCIENSIPDFFDIFCGGFFLSTGAYEDIYK